MKRQALVVALFVGTALPAAAQQQAAPPAPRFEVGVGGSFTRQPHAWGSDTAPHVRFSARLGERWGAEVAAGFQGLGGTDEWGLELNMLARYAVPVGPARDWKVGVTFGGIAFYRRLTRWSFQGDENGRPVLVRTGMQWTRDQLFPTGGFFVERPVASRLAVRVEAQVVPCYFWDGVGVRLGAGVSVPLGRY